MGTLGRPVHSYAEKQWTATDRVPAVARLLMALVLALVLVTLLSVWLARAAPKQGWGLADTADARGVHQDSEQGLVKAVLARDPRVEELMGKITVGTVLAYERALTGEEAVLVGHQAYTITTRHSFSGEPISQATRYAYEHFQGLGLDVDFHPFTYDGRELRNVVAEQPGLRWPDEIYLVTAHLDDMPPGLVAPGADDNASGSAAVLVAADLLSLIDFDCTLRFVLFVGEEQLLLGSAAYAAEIATSGDDVRGMLNLDMIGYNSDADPIVDLHARSTLLGSIDIAETFSQVVAAYNLNLTPDILVDNHLGNYSDNKSFWDRGYPAILAIEDRDDDTPYYHTPSDTLGTLDLDYFVEFVRAGVGTFAHMGCLSTGLLTGTVRGLDTGSPLAAVITAIALTEMYSTTAGPSGHYTLTLPSYTFTVRANLPGYYPVTTKDVVVLSGQTTAQHFALEPWPFDIYMPVLVKQVQRRRGSENET
jgi:hypothetical protein